jgi:hypothetical protein
MKIKTYNSSVNISGGQAYRSVANFGSSGLEDIASSLSSVAKDLQRKEDEKNAIIDYTNTANADLAVTELGEKLKDDIANGGKYSGSVKQFNDEYQKIYDQYSTAIMDPKAKAEFDVRMKKEGLRYNLSLKDAVRSRAKSDASTAANTKMSILSEKLSRLEAGTGMGPPDPNARKAILSEMASTIAPLERLGILNGGEGSQKLKAVIEDAQTTAVKIMAQNDPVAAQEKLKTLYDSGVVGPDVYSQMLGPINNAVEQLKNKQKADLAVSSWMSGDYSAIPTKAQSDIYFQQNVLPALSDPNIDPATAEQMVTEYTNKVGMVPTAIENSLVSRLNSYDSGMSKDDKARLASDARMVASMDYGVIKRTGGLSEDDYMKARLIKSRLDSGIPEADAVESVMSSLNSTEQLAQFKSSKKELYSNSIANYGNSIASQVSKVNSELGASDKTNNIWQPTYESAYALARVNGANKSEAHEQALKEVKGTYGTFDGVVVENPIDSPIFGIPRDVIKTHTKIITSSAMDAIRPIIGEDYAKNAKVVLSGDRTTIAQANSNVPYYKLGFVVSVIEPGDDIPTPVFDDQGRLARVSFGEPDLQQEVNQPMTDAMRGLMNDPTGKGMLDPSILGAQTK